MERLRELLAARGFDTFREARHRLDLTQRQANGRFSVEEADQLIERLEAGVQVADSLHEDLAENVPMTESARRRAGERRRRIQASSIVDVADDVLADELVRRGWCCIPPTGGDA